MTENEALLRLQYMYDSDKSFMVGRRKEIEMAMQAIKENQQYHAIGTVEEFKALKEKAEPKKPIIKLWSEARCPSCLCSLSESLGDGYYKHFTSLKRCDCGQKLDWES